MLDMIRYLRPALTSLLALTITVPAGAQTTPQLGIRSKTPDAIAFTNARIIVRPDLTYDSATLVIAGGKVLDVGASVAVPEGTVTVDLEGRTIYPGFIDPFVEYGVGKTEKPQRQRFRRPRYEAERVGGDAWNEAIHAEKNWSTEFKPDEKKSRELMQLGFTVVQTARLDGIFRGRACVVLLGESLPNDLLIRPRSWHVLSFDKGSSTQDYPTSLMGSIALIRQTLYDADWYARAHRAYRLNPSQKAPEFNAAIEALADIANERLIFDAGTGSRNLLRAGRIAGEFGLTGTLVAGGYEYAYLEQVKAIGATLILPLDFPEAPSVKTPEDNLDVTLAQLRHWETAPSNPARLDSSGVRFALTTYRLKNIDMFRKNLRTAIARGLSRQAALAALTTVPAEICGVTEMTGTLDKGKLASFFICDGDIFEKDTEIYSVWVAGKKYELKPLPTTEFSGEYKLTVESDTYSLFIRGKPSRLKGELRFGERKETLRHLECERNWISFAVRLDTVETIGVTRFSGRKVADTISGHCVLADGRTVDWQALRLGPAPEPEDTTEQSSPKKDTLIARLTSPNKAFGYVSRPPMENVLIRNATVWTAEEGGILRNADVLVIDGKFARVGRNLTADPGVRSIDATGKHVTPGIIDAHSHIAISGDVNEGTFALTPEVRIADVINPEDINIYRQLAG
ncbi:MAG: amidohydrolase family protein, partial [Phycisphaerales bacterium]